MTPEEMKKLGIDIKEKENTPAPLKEREPVYSDNKHALDDAKTEFEMKKLEFEKKKLDVEMAKFGQQSPTDAFQLILQMKDQFNTTLLNMQKERFETEIRMVKLMSDKGGEIPVWFEMLEPYIPSLLGRFTGKGKTNDGTEEPIYIIDASGKMIPNPKIVKSEEPQIPVVAKSTQNSPDLKDGLPQSSPVGTSNSYEMDLKQYQADVKAGKISFEQAWADFQEQKENFPSFYQKLTEEEFKEMYDKIRYGK